MRDKQDTIKQGFIYHQIKFQFKPFDILFFRGNSILSDTICALERRGNKVPQSGDFSHVGMIMTSEVINHPNVLPGKYYLLESTVNGFLGKAVVDVNGEKKSGVHLCDLDNIIQEYDANQLVTIAWGKLINNPFDYTDRVTLKDKITQFYMQYNKRSYDFNPYSLLSSICPCMRPERKLIETMCETENWVFCSELVAILLKYIGVYPQTLNEKNVTPRDIAYPNADTPSDHTPVIINDIVYVTTSKFRPKNFMRIKLTN